MPRSRGILIVYLMLYLIPLGMMPVSVIMMTDPKPSAPPLPHAAPRVHVAESFRDQPLAAVIGCRIPGCIETFSDDEKWRLGDYCRSQGGKPEVEPTLARCWARGPQYLFLAWQVFPSLYPPQVKTVHW
jgi:hypothetical protein